MNARGETMLKKGATLAINIVVVCVILLVALIIYLAVFQGLFKKEGGQINTQISGLEDHDGDGVINMYDKCCCTTSAKIGQVLSNGCLPDETPTKETSCSECIK
jgi:hypothetical protein